MKFLSLLLFAHLAILSPALAGGVECGIYTPDGPGTAPWALLVRTPSIGGAENAACFSYPPVTEEADRLGVIDIRE
jgi:hypothetical protein